MAKRHHEPVRSRNEAFADRTNTQIWQEHACSDNPYIAESALCHGYDLIELMDQCSFVEVFYLLFRGELPTPPQAKLLETLMVGLINPGPRHSATRAAMNAGVGKTLPVHILPIATTVMGGDHLGGGAIEPAMRFLLKHYRRDPKTIAHEQQAAHKQQTQATSECDIAPGFGTVYGGIDLLSHRIATKVVSLPGAGSILQWGQAFAVELNESGQGWLATGLAAAVFAELGFKPKAGGSLFQLLSAPGLAAHGLELSNKPFTAMPYVRDEHYVIEK